MTRNSEPVSIDAHRSAKPRRDRRDAGQVVLVLQGGGALGGYQAGVYQALHERGMEPDWVIGTSIGAINAALIAGNAPEQRLERLQAFWSRMQREPLGAGIAWPGGANLLDVWRTVTGGIPGFFQPNWPAFLSPHLSLGPRAAGFYSTAALDETLTELVDFELIKANAPRLTVGAAHVRTGHMRYFDSRDGEVGKTHVMASGALPPSFPAVFIDGEGYWDGGILSNTPIEAVFDDRPRLDSLIFSTHVWSGAGPEPDTMWQVLHRQKNVQFASKTESQVMRQQQLHRLRHVINLLAAEIPEARRAEDEIGALAAYGCPTTMHVIQLQAPELDGENHYKDIDFSPSGVRERWEAGYRHTSRTLELAPWLGEFDPLEGLILHDAVNHEPSSLGREMKAEDVSQERRSGVASA